MFDLINYAFEGIIDRDRGVDAQCRRAIQIDVSLLQYKRVVCWLFPRRGCVLPCPKPRVDPVTNNGFGDSGTVQAGSVWCDYLQVR